jgi:hypothetical protein
MYMRQETLTRDVLCTVLNIVTTISIQYLKRSQARPHEQLHKSAAETFNEYASTRCVKTLGCEIKCKHTWPWTMGIIQLTNYITSKSN